MKKEDYYIDVACQQKFHHNERICGDVFLSKKISEEKRIIAVLSDGMGHGVKANVLATLTATMALNFTAEHKDYSKIAEIITKTLPVCSERGVSYSTFTIIDCHIGFKTNILEFENPSCIIYRDDKIVEPEWEIYPLKSGPHEGKNIRFYSFVPQLEDRILFCSDGVIQSGMSKDKYITGYGEENLRKDFLKLIRNTPTISARKIAHKIITLTYNNDGFAPKDDISCVSVYYREPRKMMIVTGPPSNKDKDREYGERVAAFDGRKIVCGGSTADILARELEIEIDNTPLFSDDELPPANSMEGFELVTEGILTLNKVVRILNEHTPSYELQRGPADLIVKELLKSDEIYILAGTAINEAHQDPTLPVELELRRTVTHRISRLLEEKFLKKVILEFI